jgi:hypothetical protein
VLTVVAGRVVHGDQEFKNLAPPLPPAMPDWSPVRAFGGYQHAVAKHAHSTACSMHRYAHAPVSRVPVWSEDMRGFWGALGCGCFTL